ncbi:MAG: xylulokinase [Phycisphaerales bacterium]
MLLGIDIGTSAVKVSLVDGARGQVVAGGSAPCGFDVPRPGWTETPAPRWWSATVEAIADLRRATGQSLDAVRAVGLSGQMHGAVLLDQAALDGAADGQVDALRPVIMWNDQRTAGELPGIEAAAGGRAALVRASGNRALAGFTLPKLLWVRRHEPETWAHVRRFVCPKDFVRLQLTGAAATDVAEAAGSLLFDVVARRWNAGLASVLELDPDILPTVHESGAVAGTITPWAAAATGLPAGTPVVAGSGDNQCGAAGAGVTRAGRVLATLGTSGVIYAHAAVPRVDAPADGASESASDAAGRVHLMCAADGRADRAGEWSVTACVLSAAGALQWARDVVAPDTSFDALMHEASLAPPGSGGVRFLPHLAGERCPYPDPEARGAWTGLGLGHGRGHLIRAVLEGVTCTMAAALQLVEDLDVPVDRVRLGGGGNQAELWRRMQADLYGHPVARLNVEEGPAFGAALLAGVGIGDTSGIDAAADAMIEVAEVLDPAPPAAYRTLVEEYADLYAALDDPRVRRST